MADQSPNIQIKRVYDPPSKSDGRRILVDRLWPRGLSKTAARLDLWARDVAPSDELRKWYDHDPDRWHDFRLRYFKELDSRPEAVEPLLEELMIPVVTLLFGTRERSLNNAAALREYVLNLLIN